ncbi:MAG: flagellar basal body rod protein FlgB [Rhodothalassiaceae bacterium]
MMGHDRQDSGSLKMDLSKIPLMAALKDRMQWLNRNQLVHGQNIANADTPGYRPKRQVDQDFSSLVDRLALRPGGIAGPKPVSMRMTNAAHMTPGGGLAGSARIEEAPFDQVAPDGNAVDLESELMTVAQNQMDYGLMTELYRKQVGLLKTALRGRDGNN